VLGIMLDPMKFAAIVEFPDTSKLLETRPLHRAYLASLIEKGSLMLAGGFADRSGGMILFEAGSTEEVEAMLQADPFQAAGVYGPRRIRPYNPVFQNPALFPPIDTATAKWAAIIEYPNEPETIAAVRPKHREYLGALLAEGKLAVSGPFTDDTGALIVYAAETAEGAEALLKADPFFAAGIFSSYQMRPWGIVLGDERQYKRS
jgi:uncharacterized protein